jgi:hypothetical protein
VRFSGPDIRDLTANPDRFVRRRLEDKPSVGFNYVPRTWLELGLSAFHGENGSGERALAAFDAALPGRKGMTAWKLQHAPPMRRMLERYIAIEPSSSTHAIALFTRLPRLTLWHDHQLTIKLDLWIPERGVLRCVWTERLGRLGRRGVTLRVSGLLAHAQAHIAEPIKAVEVVQLRHQQRAVWGRPDLELQFPRLADLLDWADRQANRKRAS